MALKFQNGGSTTSVVVATIYGDGAGKTAVMNLTTTPFNLPLSLNQPGTASLAGFQAIINGAPDMTYSATVAYSSLLSELTVTLNKALPANTDGLGNSYATVDVVLLYGSL